MARLAFIDRSLEPVLRRAVREFPVVTLTGPRQSGKTTLLKRLFGETYRYVSFDAIDSMLSAENDPRAFLDLNPPPVILDEIQHAPALLSYIKERVDARRERPGQYILTGSQNLLLAKGVTESLAGRTAILRLLPLSRREIEGSPGAVLPWTKGPRRGGTGHDIKDLWTSLLRGGYPELAAQPKRGAALWHDSYIQTYLERDVRSLKQLGDLTRFQSFLKVIASRSAQVLNLSDFARDVGVAVNTAKAWLSVLQATYQVFIIPPYFANVGKRQTKSPKLYMSDVGTLAHLLGLREPEMAMSSPMAGAIWETAVVVETYRALTHLGVEPPLFHWRTAGGAKVDLVADTGKGLVPIEIKASSTANRRMASGIEVFRKDFGARAERGLIVYAGTQRLPIGKDAFTYPFGEY